MQEISAEKVRELNEKIPQVYEAGIRDGIKTRDEEFWKEYLNDGKSTSYVYSFAGKRWNDTTFNPRKDIVVGYNTAVSMFQNSGIQDLRGILNRNGVVLNTSEGGNMTNMFHNAKITHMPTLNLKKGSSASLFSGLTSLLTIEKLIVNENYVFGSAFFQNCTSLYEIAFEGNIGTNLNAQWCPFNTPSIINIVEHLWDGASGKTLTLSEAAILEMEFPHTSKESGITYNSWDELINTKPNWLISKFKEE